MPGVGIADCPSKLMDRGGLTISLSIWLVDTLSDDSAYQRAHRCRRRFSALVGRLRCLDLASELDNRQLNDS